MSNLRNEALEYHKLGGKPGKIEVTPTKPLDTQRDLAMAYTPGVAEPVRLLAAERWLLRGQQVVVRKQR